MEILWVRWFGRDLSHKAGWKARRPHRVGFIDSASDGAFGFLDPAQEIRAAHLITAFHYGRTSELLPKSIARQPSEQDQDWNFYYVNCFVDRDMFMRYCDHAVGHKTAPSSQNTSPGKSDDVATTDEEMDVDSGAEPDRTLSEDDEESPMGSPDSDVEEKESDAEASELEEELDGDDENEEELDDNGENEQELAGDGEGNFVDIDDEEDCGDDGYDEL
ncbi:hypothetical protein B0H19DRAFT_952627 [Mycena capillaripes]|nr:hypothetical protein B0H19DRAFT_952627 [Mycena capillaripes]